MRKIQVILMAGLLAGLLTGCAGRGETSAFDPGQSGIYVSDEGTFSTATVEVYENKDYYREEEWKAYLEETAAGFNAANKEGAVTLNSCSLKDGTARMMFDYADGEALVKFTKEYEDTANAVDLIRAAAVAESIEELRAEDAVLVKASDGKTVSLDEIAKKENYHVVTIESSYPVKLQTEGKIIYASEGMNFISSFKVEPAPGRNYIIFK